mmetsp:Transcript_25986/g.50888  ORF Transcript_25986/g.50888 Transcript_25986/m.50888 type:complete len:402 (-) Transcript_25986:701-1906(-)|eukprot:CAMPEP_0172940190 /NCGR_PEP_ID=MMETSP1075-20121228/223910_1 /TAXON_ID=2916 /ORGANISM="Ceratium fusus, Strain PA161109" /LENGTH=401 /DNA_ID=CAMNT_0013801585 /DNA_START=96 /DNA_END=1301 /DNA_ORIENTATION=-
MPPASATFWDFLDCSGRAYFLAKRETSTSYTRIVTVTETKTEKKIEEKVEEVAVCLKRAVKACLLVCLAALLIGVSILFHHFHIHKFTFGGSEKLTQLRTHNHTHNHTHVTTHNHTQNLANLTHNHTQPRTQSHSQPLTTTHTTTHTTTYTTTHSHNYNTTHPGHVPPLGSIPAPVPAPELGNCVIWGDPHIETFDRKRVDCLKPGAIWLVKADKIKIQAFGESTAYSNGTAVVKFVAIGGRALKGNVVAIGARYAALNGTRVFHDVELPTVLKMMHRESGTLVDIPQNTPNTSKKHIVHVEVFDGTSEPILIQVDRWFPSPGNEYINVWITMRPLPGQDGYCGNFDGVAHNDAAHQVQQRIGERIPQEQLLFDTRLSATLNAAKQTVKPDLKAKVHLGKA